MIRQNWNNYFLDIAEQVATRATCKRKQVGCVIVKDKTIVATGYNGSLPGEPHCIDDECFMHNNHCIATVHAETNAINQAAKNGVSLKGATIYCTLEPCWYCFKNIISSGITSIYFKEAYGTKTSIHENYILKNSNTILYKKVVDEH